MKDQKEEGNPFQEKKNKDQEENLQQKGVLISPFQPPSQKTENRVIKMNQTKLRVLCLHGFQTNARIMEYQTRQWRKYFEGSVKFEYLNGQYVIKGADAVDPAIKRMLLTDENVNSWAIWREKDREIQLMEDLKFLINYMEKEGPFDGLMGFSQGGGFINSLLQFNSVGRIKIPVLPKFFIIVNSPFFHQPIGKGQIDYRTIHLWSPQDQIVNEPSLIMTTFYKNPLVISHSYGHRIPSLDPVQIALLQQVFESFLKSREEIVSYNQIPPSL